MSDIINSEFDFKIFDIRNKEEYDEIMLPGSIHIDLSSPNILKRFEPYKGHHIVIMGDRFNEGRILANKLVEFNFPYVSVLNGGIDAFIADASSSLSRGGLPPL